MNLSRTDENPHDAATASARHAHLILHYLVAAMLHCQIKHAVGAVD
jgi:hypothetical protein